MPKQAPVLDVQGVWKSFAGQVAVRDVSFRVEPGHVLGVVGPNGAGKTTSIRMALGILAPDRGRVEVLGRPLDQEGRQRIGYLPEERGLYERRAVVDTVSYLGELKGLDRREARRRAHELLELMGLGEHTHKKSAELSHGMAQLVQLASTIIHEPDLIVLDEPFTALDPVNVRKLKDLVGGLRERGAALVLCTHQMNQVEELCDDVVMINRGSVALAGSLQEVRRRHRGNSLRVACRPAPEGLEGVKRAVEERGSYRLELSRGTKPEQVLRQILRKRNATVERFEVATPSMEEIFVSVAAGDGRLA